jgi:hypothetical protein
MEDRAADRVSCRNVRNLMRIMTQREARISAMGGATLRGT